MTKFMINNRTDASKTDCNSYCSGKSERNHHLPSTNYKTTTYKFTLQVSKTPCVMVSFKSTRSISAQEKRTKRSSQPRVFHRDCLKAMVIALNLQALTTTLFTLEANVCLTLQVTIFGAVLFFRRNSQWKMR